MKILGVTFNNRLSFDRHIAEILVSFSQTLFAVRTLHSHGMPPKAIHTVFQAVVEAKLCYAGPAWYGYTTAAEREKIGGFLRRAVRLGYRGQLILDLVCRRPTLPGSHSGLSPPSAPITSASAQPTVQHASSRPQPRVASQNLH